uniref:Pyrokinin-5 n=1 Tax=Panchlora viridis TaxID=344693 RepID=PPK5_PANVI|nr:RecName: Full=Pyrokinin-5; Short=Panvi-PK-5; AltName: Full=FXPRL-amide; AltName: Full=PanVi-Capa-PK [Panchlora viridis]
GGETGSDAKAMWFGPRL